MFAENDRLGFTQDDLDLSAEAERRRNVLAHAAKAALLFRLAIAGVLVPCAAAIAVQAMRSNQDDAWLAFWITLGILVFIGVVLEVTIVRKGLRAARQSVGVD